MNDLGGASGLPNAKRLRVLFLCTHNSARSQIAEALLRRKGRDRFIVGSAGTQPGATVHPMAMAVLAEHGIDWTDHRPKSTDDVSQHDWDLIITVCDRARESCPSFPGRPVFAHWSIEDPSGVVAGDGQRTAFRAAMADLGRRIDLLLSLPLDRLEQAARRLSDVDPGFPPR